MPDRRSIDAWQYRYMAGTVRVRWGIDGQSWRNHLPWRQLQGHGGHKWQPDALRNDPENDWQTHRPMQLTPGRREPGDSLYGKAKQRLLETGETSQAHVQAI